MPFQNVNIYFRAHPITYIITLKNTAAQTLRENTTDDFDQTTSKKKSTQRDVYSTHTTGLMDGYVWIQVSVLRT